MFSCRPSRAERHDECLPVKSSSSSPPNPTSPRYGIAEDLVVQTLALLPIEVYSRPSYAAQLTAARALLSGRDDDDAPLAALAMTLRIPIWSNDRDYEAFPLGSYTTAQLLKILDV